MPINQSVFIPTHTVEPLIIIAFINLIKRPIIDYLILMR